MTIQELVAKYEKQRAALQNEEPYFLAASTAHADMSERIFTDGINASGEEIGQYKPADPDKPLYIGALDTPVALPKTGKKGEAVFKNGKPHKSTYFPSYKDFRAKIGRRSDYVNLQLFGNLMTEFTATLKRDAPTRWYASVTRVDNVAKANGAESRYGSIFALLQRERDAYRDALNYEIMKILNA
jgi:hypothetical protein